MTTMKIKKERLSNKKLNKEFINDIINIARSHTGKIRFELDGDKIIIEADNRLVSTDSFKTEVPTITTASTEVKQLEKKAPKPISDEEREQIEKDKFVLEKYLAVQNLVAEDPVAYIEASINGEIELDV